MGALTPLGKADESRRTWWKATVAYTAAGLLTSSLVGAALGGLGLLVMTPDFRKPASLLVFGVAIAGVLRQYGSSPGPPSRVKRQTSDVWAKKFPTPVAAMLWGLDLGLTFSTRWTFSGLSLFTMLAVLAADPIFGAALFGSLWLGRASSPWVVALAGADAGEISRLLDAIGRQYRQLKTVNAFAVSMSGLALLAWTASRSLVPS